MKDRNATLSEQYIPKSNSKKKKKKKNKKKKKKKKHTVRTVPTHKYMTPSPHGLVQVLQ
jgi:hypothetical protein